MHYYGHLFHPLTLTAGERLLTFGYAIVIGSGAILTQMIIDWPQSAMPAFWPSIAGALAAGVAVYAARHWMGRGGVTGLMQAVIGSALICVVTLILVLLFTVPFFGTAILSDLLTATQSRVTTVALLWGLSLAACHVLQRAWRKERETIYNSILPEPSPLRQYSVLSRLRRPDTLAHQRARWTGN